MLTSLTTFIGLVPLLAERSLQAQWLIPIAIGLAFGVAFALLVALFFVPALYGIGADIRRFFKYLISGVEQDRFDARLLPGRIVETGIVKVDRLEGSNPLP